ncbi:MAG: glucose-1-phosphate adenylyltransferase subunit GlgD [Lachnospiraceae bacterium]|nr:glucose-1-phosphate adenylyltransferase subunit GlgD [Lachnospiraceae bacterium]
MKAVGIILAGGNNKRMKDLTARRAIAAMPMAGTFRAVDFALSNMSNSKIQKVAVLTQYNTKSLDEHLNSSKWWNFGRKQGGLFVYHPTITPENSNWYRGTLDAMYQNIHFLKESHEPYVVIASGDGVYKLDFNEVMDYHIQKRADITLVSTRLRDWEDSSRFGQITTDEDGRVVEFAEKPLQEVNREANCGIYIIRRRLLIELLERSLQEERYDFIRDIIIRYTATKRIYSYHLDSYWSNISSVRSYYETNMDFLKKDVRDFFFKGDDAIMAKIDDFPPAKYNYGSHVRNSLVSSGSIINGTVEDSVIFKKSFIGNNCVIKNSIILNDVYIGDNTVIENCIVESHGTIYANSHYAGSPDDVRIVVESNNRFTI